MACVNRKMWSLPFFWSGFLLFAVMWCERKTVLHSLPEKAQFVGLYSLQIGVFLFF